MGEPIEIRIYRGRRSRAPFSEWLASLRDKRTVGVIQARLNRLRLGNFGDCRPVGGGVHELRIDFGPGYRVYFGREGQSLVILLCAGSKKRQWKEIEAAKEYWRDYLYGQD